MARNFGASALLISAGADLNVRNDAGDRRGRRAARASGYLTLAPARFLFDFDEGDALIFSLIGLIWFSYILLYLK